MRGRHGHIFSQTRFNLELPGYVAPTIFAAAVGVLVWLLQSRIDALRQEPSRLQDDRRKVYVEVLDPHIRAFAGARNRSEANKVDRHIRSFDYRRASFEFNLLTSDKVVRALNKTMQSAFGAADRTDSEGSPQLLLYWADTLLEIRKDLGNRDTKLDALEMLESQITDIQKLRNSAD